MGRAAEAPKILAGPVAGKALGAVPFRGGALPEGRAGLSCSTRDSVEGQLAPGSPGREGLEGGHPYRAWRESTGQAETGEVVAGLPAEPDVLAGQVGVPTEAKMPGGRPPAGVPADLQSPGDSEAGGPAGAVGCTAQEEAAGVSEGPLASSSARTVWLCHSSTGSSPGGAHEGVY